MAHGSVGYRTQNWRKIAFKMCQRKQLSQTLSTHLLASSLFVGEKISGFGGCRDVGRHSSDKGQRPTVCLDVSGTVVRVALERAPVCRREKPLVAYPSAKMIAPFPIAVVASTPPLSYFWTGNNANVVQRIQG